MKKIKEGAFNTWESGLVKMTRLVKDLTEIVTKPGKKFEDLCTGCVASSKENEQRIEIQ